PADLSNRRPAFLPDSEPSTSRLRRLPVRCPVPEAGGYRPGRPADQIGEPPAFLLAHPGGHKGKARRRGQLAVVAEDRRPHAPHAGFVFLPVVGASFLPDPLQLLAEPLR